MNWLALLIGVVTGAFSGVVGIGGGTHGLELGNGEAVVQFKLNDPVQNHPC